MVDVVFGSVESANQFLGCFECCESVLFCVPVLKCSNGLVYLVDETAHAVVLVGAVFIGTVGGTIGMSAVGMSTV